MQDSRTLMYLLGALFVVTLGAEVVFFIYLAHGSWLDRVGFVLSVLSVYGIGMGLIAKLDVVQRVTDIVEEMTSPNLARFYRGNFLLLSLAFAVLASGLDPRRRPDRSWFLGCLGMLLLLPMGVVMFAYSVLHLFAIAPLAYPCYVLASSLIESIRGAGGTVEYEFHEEGDGPPVARTTIREIVEDNVPAVRGFLIGIPATGLSFAVKLAGLFGVG